MTRRLNRYEWALLSRLGFGVAGDSYVAKGDVPD